MKHRIQIIFGVLILSLSISTIHAQTNWRQKVAAELPLLGHRNWIVVVDSAYPLQTSAGIEVLETGEDQLAVADYVLGTIRASRHVRPLAHIDAELKFVPESEAPGVERYRAELKKRLQGIPTDYVLHQDLINLLNKTGESFHVLVLKSNMTIPYTSLFLQLDCKYWGADSEAKLREVMKAASSATH